MATLSPIQKRFVLHWGEMGTRWGINRTVAEIHALLYLWPEPMHAADIAETLSVARSNVSTSLRELQSWGLVKVVHVMGDRRDHFGSMKDVCEMARVVLDERKRREFDPTLQMLRTSVEELGQSKTDKYTRERLAEMLEFFDATTSLYEEISRVPTGVLKQFLKVRGKWKDVLGLMRGR
jgi:DNA-binding transcriptional regulator GbsR (MarR family)